MKESFRIKWTKLCALTLAMMMAFTLSLTSLVSCDFSSMLGNGDDDGRDETGGEDDGEDEEEIFTIQPTTYGDEYKHTMADMGADTRLSLGKADIIT